MPGRVSAPARPKTARLFASVPPDVKITSPGSAPKNLRHCFPANVPRHDEPTAQKHAGSQRCPPPENTAASPRAPLGPRESSRCDPGRSARDSWTADRMQSGGQSRQRSVRTRPTRKRGMPMKKSGPAQSAIPTHHERKPQHNGRQPSQPGNAPEDQAKRQGHQEPEYGRVTTMNTWPERP